MKKRLLYLSLFSLFSLLLIGLACTRLEPFVPPDPSLSDEQILETYLHLPDEPFDYLSGFDTQIHGENILFQGGEADPAITLGRVLFYEKALSADGKISCASCHQQELAFADGAAFSPGINGHATNRNTIALGSNIFADEGYIGVHFFALDSSALIADGRFPPGLFWDARAENYSDQIKETLTNEKEMGITLESIPGRLSQLDYYPILFKKAFLSDTISVEHTLLALRYFIATIVNTNAPFDQAANEAIAENDSASFFGDFPSFTPEQNRGKQLFLTNCVSCHGASVNFRYAGPSLPSHSAANNGLDIEYTDQGMGQHMEDIQLNGVFKVPGLRNITLTAPYMHDGRFQTLEEVLEHYSTGIQAHPNLDKRLIDEFGHPRKMKFSQQDIGDLLAFFETLKDDHLLIHEKWANPFK